MTTPRDMMLTDPPQSERDARQGAAYQWAEHTFGRAAMAYRERAMRVLEEAIELAQAEGIHPGEIDKLVGWIYGKPPGEPTQEVGGLAVCLLVYCATRGVSADEVEAKEFARVQALPTEHFRRRHQRKIDAGISVPGDPPI